MPDVKKFKFTLFFTKSVGLRFTLFYREICFVAIYVFFVWRKLLLFNLFGQKHNGRCHMVIVLGGFVKNMIAVRFLRKIKKFQTYNSIGVFVKILKLDV